MIRRTLILSAAALAACSPSGGGQRVGKFEVEWTAEPPSLVVKSEDGRELLRTGADFADTRLSEAMWEMQFGSFKVTENDMPWSRAASLENAGGEGDFRLAAHLSDQDAAMLLEVTSPSPDVLAITLKAPTGNRTRMHFTCGEADRFLGFGAQADAVDHRGHRLHMWTSEPGIGKTDHDEIQPDDLWILTGTRHATSYPIPAFLSNRGFAFLADTTRRAVFDLCQANAKEWSVENWDGALTVKVFDGPKPAQALERLTADIGRQPLANDLAFAPWNDAIFGSQKVRDVADLLRREGIPSSLIWTEDFRGGHADGDSYRLLEEWDVDRTLYPDVEELAKELHDKGFRFLAYHNTFLVSDTRILAEARAKDVLVKKEDGSEYLFQGVKFTPTALVDLANPAGVAFVVEKLKHLLTLGFDGWMADFAEWLPADAKIAKGSAEAFHNEYPRAYHQAVAEAVKGADPALTTTFARSGTLRTAPFQPVVWAGDQSTDFDPRDGLPTVVTMGLNLGFGGISTYGHDIAGYQNGIGAPSTKELFFRWTTLGALSPVMRTHHGTKAKDNWWFGKDEETLEHYRRWARFHTQLWPYFRAAAQEAFDRGMPIMRQLALAFPEDPKVWTLKDEYLLGPSLLVAPVVVEGATSRTVYLPTGTWMPFFSGESVQGGAEVTIDVPLTEAGLFARPGTIVPMLAEDVETLVPAVPAVKDLDDAKGERVLHVFAGANGEWTDLDGSKYVLTSASHDAPTEVRSGGEPLPACSGAIAACAAIDPVKRVARVRGSDLASVELAAGATVVAKVEKTGALKVKELVVRW